MDRLHVPEYFACMGKENVAVESCLVILNIPLSSMLFFRVPKEQRIKEILYIENRLLDFKAE